MRRGDAEINGPLCAKCSCELAPGETVHLWDGRDYCRACVFAASPNLLALAERFPILSERISANAWDAIRAELLAGCFVAPVIVGFLCVLGWRSGTGVLAGIVVGMLVISLAIPLRVLGAYFSVRGGDGKVEMGNGWLTIYYPTFGRARWPLQDCRWHRGHGREADVFIGKVHFRSKVVIIECPLTVFFWRARMKIPCGLSPEMREVWEAFLTLAGIERTGRAWWRFV